jgi:hypothetical protein
VALVGREATAPLAGISDQKPVGGTTNPKTLMQRAEQLETAARELIERLGASIDQQTHTRLIKPILDEAAFLRDLAGNIEAIQKA